MTAKELEDARIGEEIIYDYEQAIVEGGIAEETFEERVLREGESLQTLIPKNKFEENVVNVMKFLQNETGIVLSLKEQKLLLSSVVVSINKGGVLPQKM